MNGTLSAEAFVAEVVFNADGLVPVVTQDHETGAVLMHAWMNREALVSTLETGDLTYWSRSRRELWRKGATSGHTQKLIGAWIDCDGDTLLMKVKQIGTACHTGEFTCFFRKAELKRTSP